MKKPTNSMNRRHFIVTTASGLAGTALLTGAARADALPLLPPTDPLAMALGYQPIAADVDVTRFPKRAGEAGAKQFCSNCALYKAVDETSGTCAAVPGKRVMGAGWCNAWIPVA